jgi:hypothetical protein
MINWTKTIEDGTYEVHMSTNHADPLVYAEIVIDHESITEKYTALKCTIDDNDPKRDIDYDNLGFFGTWDEARKHCEAEVVHTVRIAR